MTRSSDDDQTFDWQDSNDVLSSMIRLVGLHGVVLSTMSLGAPWRVVNARACAPVLHVVGSGEAYLHARGASDSVKLSAGDVAMLPRGGSYEITDAQGTEAPPLEAPEQDSGQRCSVRLGGSGPRTELTCCSFRFDAVSSVPLLNLLPQLVVVPAVEAGASVRGFIETLVCESQRNRVGTEGMVSRLAELVYLAVLRIHFDMESQRAETGLLAAVTHPQIGRALGLVHAELAAPWTVATLASKVGMSRAAFAQLFTEKTSASPIRYIQLCRIEEAKRMLAQTPMNLSEIGQCVGYTDPAGFSRAFRREVGVSPRDYRQASKRSRARSTA